MNGNNIPKWKLEWYLAGALPAKELMMIAALEQSDEILRTRIDALRTSDADILAKYPAAVMAKKAMGAGLVGAGNVNGNDNNDSKKLRMKNAVNELKITRPRGIPRFWTISASAGAAALVVLLVAAVLPVKIQDNSETVYATRTKGEINDVTQAPDLEVWRKAEDGAEKLAPEATVSAGDIVQLRYIVPKSCYGALLSMDGRGVLTVHLSGNDGKAAALTPGKPVALKTSYKLDDAPAFEAFYLITAYENFHLESVRERLMDVKHPINNEQGLALPEKQVAMFTLRK